MLEDIRSGLDPTGAAPASAPTPVTA